MLVKVAGGRIVLACGVTSATDYALSRSFPPSYLHLMQTTGLLGESEDDFLQENMHIHGEK